MIATTSIQKSHYEIHKKAFAIAIGESESGLFMTYKNEYNNFINIPASLGNSFSFF